MLASAPARESSSAGQRDDRQAAAAVLAAVRQRLLRVLMRRGLLRADVEHAMAQCAHGGASSVDGSARFEAADHAWRERRLRHCARRPFALERRQQVDALQLIYEASKPGPRSSGAKHLTSL
ncbi:MAG: hypothetical protein ABI537_08535 [Casimicrobiaceae bacterium]